MTTIQTIDQPIQPYTVQEISALVARLARVTVEEMRYFRIGARYAWRTPMEEQRRQFQEWVTDNLDSIHAKHTRYPAMTVDLVATAMGAESMDEEQYDLAVAIVGSILDGANYEQLARVLLSQAGI